MSGEVTKLLAGQAEHRRRMAAASERWRQRPTLYGLPVEGITEAEIEIKLDGAPVTVPLSGHFTPEGTLVLVPDLAPIRDHLRDLP